MVAKSQRGPTPEDLNPEEHGHGEKYIGKWAKRHAAAEIVDKKIRAMAFPGVGETPGLTETLASEDPAAIGASVMGSLGPQHMLTHEQTLRKWEVPPLPPSHHPGFGTSVATNIAEGRIADTPHIQRYLNKLSERMAPGGHPDPLGAVVKNRRRAIVESLVSGDPDAAWYQGKAQALIHHAAGEAGVPVPVQRKTTATVSPKMPWDITYAENKQNIKSGRAGETVFPNVAVASQIIGASQGRTPDEAAEEVAARKLQGVQRGPAAKVAASMLRGELHGSELIPQTGVSEKVQSFDVNLSDPNHPQHGYSGYVARHQLSAHTPDVQDSRAAGYEESQLEVPRTAGDPFHEVLLAHPAGTDIATSTALVARTEEFEKQRGQHGEEWAQQNAINFMPGPSQSMQWSVARGTGNVSVPPHIQAAYDARPKPTGFGGYSGPGTKMTKRDWGQV